ncbi:hypothetical protein FACS189483_06960 [Spirochaetia bacterium]|nr:hypothetical protein FACS189483_06960 [Spirochaetia bacterium]
MAGYSGLSVFLLQEGMSYFKEDDPVGAAIFFGIVGVVGLGALGIHFIRRKKGPKKAPEPRRNYSWFTLRQIAGNYRLNMNQCKLLDSVFRNESVTNPQEVMIDIPLLDRHFKQAYIRIEQGETPEEETQQKLSLLFAIRNAVEYTQTINAAPKNQPGKPKRMKPRQFKRRQVTVHCGYHVVNLTESGKGARKKVKMAVDSHAYTGIIQDISMGGCSIKTNAVIKAGTQIKIDFSYANVTAAVLGQVIRLNRSGVKGSAPGSAQDTVMHIKFLKVPLRASNVINATVFEYAAD